MELLPPHTSDYPLRRGTLSHRHNRYGSAQRGALPLSRTSRRGSTPRDVAGQRPHAEIGAIASNLSHRGYSLRGVAAFFLCATLPCGNSDLRAVRSATSKKMPSVSLPLR